MRYPDFYKLEREEKTNEVYYGLIINRKYNTTKPVVQIWQGKQSKPFVHYSYTDIESAEKSISGYKKRARDRYESVEEAKTAKKQALSNFKSSFTKGTILTASWGYDQTNVDFYEVIDVKGRTVEIQEIGQNFTEEAFMSGHTVPDVNRKIGTPLKKRICVTAYGNGVKETIKINSSVRLSIWDGKPKYSSYYA